MNIFQLIADLMHLASIGILLLKMMTTKSAAGNDKRVCAPGELPSFE